MRSPKIYHGRMVKKARRPLTIWETGQGYIAALTGVPLATYQEKIKAGLIENTDGAKPSKAKKRQASRTAERRLMEKESAEAEKQLKEQAPLSVKAQAAVEGAQRKFSQLRLPPVPVKAMAALVIFAILLLAADAVFTFSGLADAMGIDLSQALGSASFVGVLCAVGGTFVLIAANAFCGSSATAEDPPIRRFWGRIGLIGVGVMIGLVRGVAVADPSVLLAGLNVVLSVASGLVAGRAHHSVADYLKQKADAAEKLRAARQPVVDAERSLAQIERKIGDAAATRKRLALALDGLRAEPERQATDDEELRRIQEARLAAAKFVYESAARFAGKGHKKEGE